MPLPERSLRSLLDIPRSALPALPPQLLTVLAHNADLLTDRRVRSLRLERVTPVGDWQPTVVLAFEDLDGTPRPFKPLAHPPHHNGGLTDGSKEHRRKDQG